LNNCSNIVYKIFEKRRKIYLKADIWNEVKNEIRWTKMIKDENPATEFWRSKDSLILLRY